jgi:hypothetical protein
MNIREGARRIQLVGRSLLYFAGICIVLAVLGGLIGHYSASMNPVSVGLVSLFGAISVYTALFGTAILILGWIIEGFAIPPDSHAGD